MVPVPENPPEPDLVPLSEDEQLPALTSADIIEEGGTLQIQEGQTESVDLSHSGGLAAFRLGSRSIECLAYGPDNQTALAADEKRLFFLDLKTGQGTPAPPRHRDPITCLTFSADGRHTLSGDEDGGLHLWDVPARKSVRWLEGHRDEVTCAAFSPNGKYAVSGDENGSIRLWDLARGKPISLARARWDERVNCVAVSPDGRRILAIGDMGTGKLWSMRTGEVVCKMKKGAYCLDSAAFSSDGATVLAASRQEFTVNRWKVPSGERQSCFGGYADNHPCIRKTWVTPNARAVLAMGMSQDTGPRYHTETPEIKGRVLGFALAGWVGLAVTPLVLHAAKCTANALDAAVAYQPPGKGYYLEFWSVHTEIGVNTIQLGPAKPRALASSVDGHRVLAGFEGGHVILYGL
jgi:WD40 repeat protein